MIDIVDDAGSTRPHWSDLVVVPEISEMDGRLELLAAGPEDDGYARRVQTVDWERQYREHDMGDRIEQVRREWVDQYDTILVDSRTGLTDIGGICSAQLPDVLILAFTANHQSLDGVIDAVHMAEAARDRLPFDRSRVLTVPLPSRFDAREEYKRAERWRETFADRLQEFYSAWVPAHTDYRKILELTTIPYLSYWSFGEEIPALVERSTNPEYVSYYFETVAALLARGLDGIELLAESRDSYVDQARQRSQASYSHDVYLSFAPSSMTFGRAVAEGLTAHGLKVAYDEKPDGRFGPKVEALLDQAQFFVPMIDEDWSSSRYEQSLLERAMRLTSDSSSQRLVLPVLLSDVDVPGSLRQFQFLDARGASPGQVESIIVEAVERLRS